MLKILAIVVVVLIVAILIYAATKPDLFRVQRSASINAPPEKIFPLVNDLHRHSAWSPWDKKDPAMKRTYSGAPAGKGAIYEWDGNGDVGQGRMEVLESSPSRVAIKLDFIKPFEGHNVATFTMTPAGGATAITWAMDGPTPFLGKLIGVFMNMDKMIGTDFADGLSNLKAVAEK